MRNRVPPFLHWLPASYLLIIVGSYYIYETSRANLNQFYIRIFIGDTPYGKYSIWGACSRFKSVNTCTFFEHKEGINVRSMLSRPNEHALSP